MYVYAYYIGVIASLGVLGLLLMARRLEGLATVRAAIVLMVVSIYFIGMARVDGVDYPNYRYAYDFKPDMIPDIGFQWLIRLFKGLDAPMEVMVVCIGIVNLLVVRRLARHFNVSYFLLLLLWFFHIAVVRDFAQLRIGLAMSLALMGVCGRSAAGRSAWYVGSASMHYTALAFIIAYEVCRRVAQVHSARTRVILVTGMAGMIGLVGLMLSKLAFLDERIELYLQWNQAGYGAPVESFGALMLHFVVLGLAWSTRRSWTDRVTLRTLVYLEIAGIMVFIAFSQVAIFAFRLSNVILSLYPILILLTIELVRVRWAERSASRLATGLLALFFALILVVRPGSLSIIQRVIL